jgi:NADPH-dependent 2,4-dienoyl-CoA reductase/sulfur reductase-like enzyme
LQLLHDGRDEALPYDALILATGAADRVLPFPGWTLPGVYTLGAAQVALKFQASLVGTRVVFAGTGPLLYLVAWQYASHGGEVLAVLDSAPASAKLKAAPGLLARPMVAAKGAYFVARLRLKGIPIHHGVSLIKAEGDRRVTALRWQAHGVSHTTACDAVAFGHGLRSETQLADLAGCAFGYDALEQTWLPTRDAAGRSSVPGIYLAGDGAGIHGADSAELSGARAALAAIEDFIAPPSRAETARIDRALAPHRTFRQGLATAFTPPPRWAADAPDELIVCRCEEISAGELRDCVRRTGTREMNRLKALTRIGMGRCQGRMCAPAASRLLAQAAGCALKDVGRLRGQAPVKPLPISVMRADRSLRDAPVPEEERDD